MNNIDLKLQETYRRIINKIDKGGKTLTYISIIDLKLEEIEAFKLKLSYKISNDGYPLYYLQENSLSLWASIEPISEDIWKINGRQITQ